MNNIKWKKEKWKSKQSKKIILSGGIILVPDVLLQPNV